MAMLSCPSCAHAIPDQDPFCPQCGANVSATVPLSDGSVPKSPAHGIDFRPGQRFARRFTIIERVGEGGMGVVYKAIDTALDAQVALKLIRPDLVDVGNFADRFRREVRLTRQITHPNVCRVHDIGDDAGILFLSMEWIEGETLQRFLRQTGNLRDVRALEIAEKLALALEAAHAAGVVHRDLKPANVMLDHRGDVRVLDFGLAVKPGHEDITGSHVAVGTLAYMSPEQRTGGPVDARADLYALGLILYEMLLGRRPERIPAANEPFPPEVNPEIEPLLRRLLAESPDARPASATAVRQELARLEQLPTISRTSVVVPPAGRRWRLAAAAAAVLLASATALWWGVGRDRSAPEPDPGMKPAARVFFDNGLHDLRAEAETESTIRNAIVLFHRAQQVDPDSALIMATLGEAYWVLYGRKRDTSAREEAERWIAGAERIDPSLPELDLARGRGFYLEGKHEAAHEALTRAVTAEPRLAPAWLSLAATRIELNDYEGAQAALDEAEQLAPGSFQVPLTRGNFYWHFKDLGKAAEWFVKATELKPDSIRGWNNLGAVYLHGGKLELAADAFEQSIAIEEYGDARSNLGTVMYFLGRYGEAVEHYLRATELEPERPVHWSNLGDAYLVLQRQADAARVYDEACKRADANALREPLDASSRADAALFCAQAGKAELALAHGAAAEALQPENATILVMYAAALAGLGRNDASLEKLQQAVNLGVSRAQIDARPEFVPLKDETRFRSLRELAQ